MAVWERKIFIVPGIVSILKPWAQIDQLYLWLGMSQYPSYEGIVALTFEDDGDGVREVDLCIPTKALCMNTQFLCLVSRNRSFL
jgi:hypothetical protein